MNSPDASVPFHLHTVKGILVHPELDLDRTSALITMDDAVYFSNVIVVSDPNRL